MIAPGTYRAKVGSIDDVQFGFTEKGNEQVAVAFTLLVEPYVNAQITWFGYFTDKTVETTLKALRNCGWQTDDLNDLTGVDAREVDLVIESEEDQQGRLRARVRWVNQVGGKVKLNNTMSPEQRVSFASRMKGTVVAHRDGTAPKAPRLPSAAAVKAEARNHGAVDEVPF
ncbi:MAG TPA: hypothetical protein VFD43_02035 [Planctomycetota bacterium]|nr:hypothetical protein [Planctomycetota bacterium]